MPNTDVKSPLTEAEQKAIEDLAAFLQDRTSIIYLRLLDCIERAAFVLSNDNESDEGAVLQKQWIVLLTADKVQPLRLLLRVSPDIVEIGRFLSFKQSRQYRIIKLPIDVETAIREISKNGIIPLDAVVDWICERLVSE